MTEYPVIDLFAGPGGLGEGFSGVVNRAGQSVFQVALSIEKDPLAHRTLTLRAIFRRLERRSGYYDYVRAIAADRPRIWERLVRSEPMAVKAAATEAWRAALGEVDPVVVADRIRSAVGGRERWVLIGGPPCQAYSLAGRSRMRGPLGQLFESDERHLLYQEYLRIVATHSPPLFVMENVKGLLSSQHAGGMIFDRIVSDLAAPEAALGMPDKGLRYRVVGLGPPRRTGSESSFVLRSEDYTIPQARHRVILLGIRTDLAEGGTSLSLDVSADTSATRDVIADLPRLRSGLSGEQDSHSSWLYALSEGGALITDSALPVSGETHVDLLRAISEGYDEAALIKERGRPFLEYAGKPNRHAAWYVDDELGGLLGHSTRRHMKADLWRYLYASAYARSTGRSPLLRDMPAALLPRHRNATTADAIFADRFRVQILNRPSSTVTSHIAKDGNYFIHSDVAQCRSLTVREAARLQTFPDNYAFEGGATAQYHQVGNAVPPLLARQVAELVQRVLDQ